jgi:hypothetical protein
VNAAAAAEGGCLCGAVRYRAAGPPKHVNHCHCRMCRVGSGAPIVTWVTFARVNFHWTKGAPTLRRSSDIAMRGFCDSCGTALLWQGDADPDMIDVTAGSLDRPEEITPQDHLWTESAVPWLKLADNLPRYPRSRKG